jgi:hypothetical protein
MINVIFLIGKAKAESTKDRLQCKKELRVITEKLWEHVDMGIIQLAVLCKVG